MPMKKITILALLALSACVAPTGPVEVTRFHVPDTAPLGRGTITVVPAAGVDASSLEWRSYQAAVSRQLALHGYSDAGAGQAVQRVELRLERQTIQPERAHNPVTVGLGGSTGSYGSGLGLGVGINLSGPPPAQIETRLSVAIKDRVTNAVLWEGRASFTVSAKSPLADTQLGAAKMAEALFQNFPGTSGETILVK